MARGSLVSPIVANLYMEHLEERAIREVPHPPSGLFKSTRIDQFNFNSISELEWELEFKDLEQTELNGNWN